MYLIFVDESGYQSKWGDEKALREQPFHVVSAVAIPSSNLTDIYATIRNGIAQLNLPETEAEALGKGQEIKASQIDKGEGFWGKNQILRDKVRRIYLDIEQVTYFVVCIDKEAHKRKYPQPEDPSNLALQYLLERLQGFLREKDQMGFVLIDLNKRQEAAQRGLFSRLLRQGSSGIRDEQVLWRHMWWHVRHQWQLDISNIIEIHFGDSKYSLGLQVADFVARHAYSWRKNNKDSNYPGWSFIEPRLYKYPKYKGWGYKEFP